MIPRTCTPTSIWTRNLYPHKPRGIYGRVKAAIRWRLSIVSGMQSFYKTQHRRLKFLLSLFLALGGSFARGQTSAQQPALSPVAEAASSTSWEYGALIEGGNGLPETRDGFHFLMAGGHLGKVLTGNLLSGVLQGNFEYAVEAFPFWQSYTPKFQRANCYATPTSGTTYVSPGLYCSPLYTVGGTYTGVSITPIILRWNLTHGSRLMPWI